MLDAYDIEKELLANQIFRLQTLLSKEISDKADDMSDSSVMYLSRLLDKLIVRYYKHVMSGCAPVAAGSGSDAEK